MSDKACLTRHVCQERKADNHATTRASRRRGHDIFSLSPSTMRRGDLTVGTTGGVLPEASCRRSTAGGVLPEEYFGRPRSLRVRPGFCRLTTTTDVMRCRHPLSCSIRPPMAAFRAFLSYFTNIQGRIRAERWHLRWCEQVNLRQRRRPRWALSNAPRKGSWR